MSEEFDFDLSDASSAARRLSHEANPSPLEEYRATLKLLDQKLPKDEPNMDPVTQLRTGLDYVEVLASSGETPQDIAERARRLIESYRLTNPEETNLKQMEAGVAMGMVGSLGVLNGAIDQNQVEFMFNNPSEAWQDLEAGQVLFEAVRQAKKLLQELAQSTKVGKLKLKDAEELIVALQNEIANQLAGANLKTELKRPPTKKDKIKKIGGQIIGPPSESSRIRW